MKLVIGAIAGAALLAATIALAISVRSDPDPVVVAPPSEPGAATVPAIVTSGPKVVAPLTHTKPLGSDGAQAYAIPRGGFAQWTGREGMVPGELEAFATEAGLRMSVALEQRRSTVLWERTADVAYLTELLGAPPRGEVMAAIGKSARALQEITASVQAQSRAGALSESDAIQQTRAAEDDYRKAYLTATGLTEDRFDRFFAPDRR